MRPRTLACGPLVWRAVVLASVVASAACGPSGELRGLGLGDSPFASLEKRAQRPVTGLAEPSDLAYDVETGTLWVVSDTDGHVYRIDANGAVAGRPIDVGGKDLEGIALDPATGHLLVLDEGRREVVEITREGRVVGRFQVPGGRGNRRYEGIAVDASRGEVILAHEREPAELVFVDRSGRLLRRTPVRTEDLSAVTLAPGGETLVVVGRFEEALLELDRDGAVRNRLVYNVSGAEGVAFGPDGRLFVVADHGASQSGELILFSKEGSTWR